MYKLSLNFEQILELIKQLPESEKVILKQELETDILNSKKEEKELISAYLKISESCFAQIWDNPEDEIYDTL